MNKDNLFISLEDINNISKFIIYQQVKNIMDTQNLTIILNSISVELGADYLLELDNILYKLNYKDRINKIIELIFHYKNKNVFTQIMIEQFNLFDLLQQEIQKRN